MIRHASSTFNASLIMGLSDLDDVYPRSIRERIGTLANWLSDPIDATQLASKPQLAAKTEILFSGWGAPVLTAERLRAMPRLQAIFYAGGATDYFMTEEAWARGIVLSSAISANALPVVEFTYAQIIMCLKRVWQHVRELRQTRRWQKSEPGATTFGARVGVVSLGEIGWRLAEKLGQLEVDVLAYDIHHDDALAQRCGVRYASLEEIFSTCDVVSLHTPLRQSTFQMIDRGLLMSLKPGASIINTARGGLIDEIALVEMLQSRKDVLAVLDVVDPEPPATNNPLYDLDNAVVTPHIAGSLGRECERMGQRMLEECARYVCGVPLKYEVRPREIFTAPQSTSQQDCVKQQASCFGN